ncbi:MAG TPA: acetyl-CoA C-acyltransferase, partial [Nocardioides sp.]
MPPVSRPTRGTDIVICEPIRTPVGAFGGVFANTTVTDLAATVLSELVTRTGLSEGDVDDVILGQCYPNGEAPALGRIAALDAGLGTGVPGMQIDRRCGSGLQAVLNAAAQISVGAATLIVAGGAESMSQAEHYALGLRQGIKGDGVEMMSRLARGRITAGGKNHPVPGGMIETAENVRRQYDITREAQDELAFRSQQNWKRANEAGHFKDEIIPVTVPGKRGAPDAARPARTPAASIRCARNAGAQSP